MESVARRGTGLKSEEAKPQQLSSTKAELQQRPCKQMYSSTQERREGQQQQHFHLPPLRANVIDQGWYKKMGKHGKESVITEEKFQTRFRLTGYNVAIKQQKNSISWYSVLIQTTLICLFSVMLTSRTVNYRHHQIC